jgi:hypothetical protein
LDIYFVWEQEGDKRVLVGLHDCLACARESLEHWAVQHAGNEQDWEWADDDQTAARDKNDPDWKIDITHEYMERGCDHAGVEDIH